MLFDDDVVTDREPKAGSLTGGLGGEEGIEHLFLHLRRNAGAVVADPYLHAVAEVLGRGREGGLISLAVILLFALGRCIKPVADAFRPLLLIRCAASGTFTNPDN